MTAAVAEKLDVIPEINGLSYHRFLRRLHAALKPEWYLEIGTFTGRSLRFAECNTVAVDPAFNIKHPVINQVGQQMHFMQMTSDEFFASDFMKKSSIKFDFAFLDGLHHYECLLRDFINAEKRMKPGGAIALHDCCPTSVEMTAREQCPGAWTGDVWKTLLILLEHRPDLNIQVTNAYSTGLVLIRGLNPRSKVLENRYKDAVKKYKNAKLDGFKGGIAGYYQNFDLLTPDVILAELSKG